MTAPPSASIAAADIQQTISEIVHAVLERDVDPAVDLFDQGATSLAFLRIVAEVNERFGITVDVAELEEASTEELSGLVAQQLKLQEQQTAR